MRLAVESGLPSLSIMQGHAGAQVFLCASSIPAVHSDLACDSISCITLDMLRRDI